MSLPLPGTAVSVIDAPRAPSSPTDTGTAFIVCECERGPATPVLSQSFDDWTRQLGARVSYSYGSDWAETFFREGGHSLWTSRAVSATGVAASAILQDSVPANTMTVTAGGIGTYGNNLRVIVETNTDDTSIPAGQFRLKITESGTVILVTPSFATKAQAYDWSLSQAVPIVVLTDLAGTGIPVRVVAPGTALTSGNDDRTNVNDAARALALGKIGMDYGPGQVAMPGLTTTASHTALLNHAQTFFRHAVLDLPDSATVATVVAQAAADDAGANTKAGRWGSAYWPWAVIPGLSPGSTRVVPWSAVQCGTWARNDAGGNANIPGTGEENGLAQWASGVTQNSKGLVTADLQSLNDAGVNIVKTSFSQPAPFNYGNRTLRTQLEDPLWLQASGSRLMMQIAHSANAVLRRFVHSQVDGKGHKTSQLQGEVAAILGVLYDDDALFGDTPADAYLVDAGPSVNTPASIATGLLKVQVQAAVSPGADRIELTLVREVIG